MIILKNIKMPILKRDEREREQERRGERQRDTHTCSQTRRERKTKEKESSPKNFKKKISNFLNGGGCESRH